MRISLDLISFSVPPGFKDVTGYTFSAPDTIDLLDVTYGRLPSGVTTVEALAEHRRSEALDALPGVARVVGGGPATLAGLPARTLIFEKRDDDGVADRERWTLAIHEPRSYVQVADVSRQDDPDALQRFNRSLESASLVDSAGAPLPGFVRRWAGAFWIDVPSYLLPPPTYQFASLDEKMRIEVTDHGDSPPLLEQDLATDTSLGEEVVAQSSEDVSAGAALAVVHSLRLRRDDYDGPVEEALLRAEVRAGPRSEVHVMARGPAARERPLREALDHLLQSIEAVARGGGGRP